MKKIFWIYKFFMNDLFNKNVVPKKGLTRWQLFINDFKFITGRSLLIVILSALCIYSQTQPTVKPYPGAVELSWILDNTGATAEYLIFYCQANDSTQIVLHDGSKYSEVWDYCIGSSLYNYFFVKIKTNVLPEPSYVRLGVIALGWDGTFSDMKVIPKVLKVKRAPIPGAVKVNSINIQP